MEIMENSPRKTGLHKALIGSSFFYAINRIAAKLFEVLSLWILVLLLPSSEIGIVGIAVGFISIVNVFNLSPERMIYKNFEKVKERLGEYVSSYSYFWLLKSLLMFSIAAVGAYLYSGFDFTAQTFIVLTGMTLSYLFTNLQLLMQEILFVNFKQKNVTYFNIISMVLFLASLGLLIIYPSIELYVALLTGKAAFNASGLIIIGLKELKIKFSVPKDNIAILKESIAEFGIYDHFIGAGIEVISKVFLLILGFFAIEQIAGDYTIALTLASMLTFFPIIIYRTAMLAITRISTKEGLSKIMSAFTKYSALISIIQFVIFLIALPFLLPVIAKNAGPDVAIYSILLALGTCVFTVGYAVHAIAVQKSNIKKYFENVIIPCTLLGIVSYAVAAQMQNSILVGVAYLGTAVLTNILAYLHVKANLGIWISKKLIYIEEIEMAQNLIKRFKP